MIDTTPTANVTLSVPCHQCKKPVPLADAWPVNLLVPSGIYHHDGKQVWRATGETAHVCNTCFMAEGDETA